MNYEALLDEAYETVVAVESSERFEVIPVKGHHEVIRTIITNFSQVAACVRRQPSHLIKFLSKELACSTEVSGDRLILSRKLSSKVVNEKVNKYVDIFVLCKNCSKPDTELSDSGNNGMSVRCLACGNNSEVYKI